MSEMCATCRRVECNSCRRSVRVDRNGYLARHLVGSKKFQCKGSGRHHTFVEKGPHHGRYENGPSS